MSVKFLGTKRYSAVTGWTEKDYALHIISRYGQIDGEHHKAWVIDQVAKILLGSKVVVDERKWKHADGSIETCLDIIIEKESKEYTEWVGDDEDEYDHGIAP